MKWFEVNISLSHDRYGIISTPQMIKSPNLGPAWPVLRYMVATICRWDSIPMAQTLCICQIWMYEVVWGGHQPQTWRYGIISTPQWNLSPQIWGQLGRCYDKGGTICPWDSIPMAQTLCICCKGMYEVIWGEYQPQPWPFWHHFWWSIRGVDCGLRPGLTIRASWITARPGALS